MRELRQGEGVNVMLFLADSGDHLTPKTGAILSVSVSKDGGPFNPIAPIVTERGYGWYSAALTPAHTDTLGDLVVRATASGADPAERGLSVYAAKAADLVLVRGVAQSGGNLAELATRAANAAKLYGGFGPANRYLSAVGLDGAEPFWLNLDTPLNPLQRLDLDALLLDDPGAGEVRLPLGLLTGDGSSNTWAADPAFTGMITANSRLEFTLVNPSAAPFPGGFLQLVATAARFGKSPKNWTFSLPASPAGRDFSYRALGDGTLVPVDGLPDLLPGGRRSLILGG